MDLKQLKSLVELADSDFNVTETANHLCLVQSAVSQHLARLEQELGTQVIVRKGKRLAGIFQYTLSRCSQSNQAFTLSNDDLRAQFLFQASKVL